MFRGQRYRCAYLTSEAIERFGSNRGAICTASLQIINRTKGRMKCCPITEHFVRCSHPRNFDLAVGLALNAACQIPGAVNRNSDAIG